MSLLTRLAAVKTEYDKVAQALKDVRETGYGIVVPGIDELKLEEPEIMKQGGRYGVRLKASAPSIHIFWNKQKVSRKTGTPGEARASRRANTIRQPRRFRYLLPVNGFFKNSPSSVVLRPCLRPTGAGCILLSFSHSFPLYPHNTLCTRTLCSDTCTSIPEIFRRSSG